MPKASFRPHSLSTALGLASPHFNKASAASPWFRSFASKRPRGRPRRQRGSTLSANVQIDSQRLYELSGAQRTTLLKAFQLATRAAIDSMPKQQAPASPTATAPGSKPTSYKRKRKPGEARFYAVRVGRVPGIYGSWEECQAMINAYPGASCESSCPRFCG